MSTHMDGEHVGPCHGGCEHPGLGVHSSSQISFGSGECEVLLTTNIVVLGPEGVKVN